MSINTKAQRNLGILLGSILFSSLIYFIWNWRRPTPQPFHPVQKLNELDTPLVQRERAMLKDFFNNNGNNKQLFASGYLLNMKYIQEHIQALNLNVNQLRIVNGLVTNTFSNDKRNRNVIIKYLKNDGVTISKPNYTSYMLADASGLCPDLCDQSSLGVYDGQAPQGSLVGIGQCNVYQDNYKQLSVRSEQLPVSYDMIRSFVIPGVVYSAVRNYPQLAVYHAMNNDGIRRIYLLGIGSNGNPDFANGFYYLSSASLCPDLCDVIR